MRVEMNLSLVVHFVFAHPNLKLDHLRLKYEVSVSLRPEGL